MRSNWFGRLYKKKIRWVDYYVGLFYEINLYYLYKIYFKKIVYGYLVWKFVIVCVIWILYLNEYLMLILCYL